MTILDRYIARQFALNFLILLAIFCSFIVVVDATLNIGRFARAAESLVGEDASAIRRWLALPLVVIDLWWPRLLQLFNVMLGIVMVGAMGFTCAQMVRHRELVAILASGQSLVRVARPILVVAACLGALQIVNAEVLLPRFAPLLTRGYSDAGTRDLAVTSVMLVPDGSRRLIAAESFDAKAGTMRGVFIWERDAAGLMTRRIEARSAVWEEGGWTLEDGVGVEPASADAAVAPTPRPVERIETDLDPTALTIAQHAEYMQSLSFGQVTEMMRIVRRTGDERSAGVRVDRLERIRWGRFAVLAANLLGLVIALPFFLTREPKNMAVQTAKAAPIAMGVIMGGIIGSAAPVPGVPAAIGVFLPLLALVPMTFWAFASIKS